MDNVSSDGFQGGMWNAWVKVGDDACDVMETKRNQHKQKHEEKSHINTHKSEKIEILEQSQHSRSRGFFFFFFSTFA